jgi:hypothetical protein
LPRCARNDKFRRNDDKKEQLDLGHSAIDEELGAGDETAVVGSEKEDG